MAACSKVIPLLKSHHVTQCLLVFESLLTGLITGVLIAAFRFGIDQITFFKNSIYGFIIRHGALFLLPVACALAAVGLFIGFIIKKYPMIKGSGVAQIEGVFMQKLRLSPWPELPLKFIGGVLDIGLGLSVGREGPSVQLGAYVGDAVEKIGKRSFVEHVYLLTAGAAAGIAATFNAPLAAIVFALEDLHQYFSPLLLMCVMAGAFAGDCAVSFFSGAGPIFRFSVSDPYPASLLPLLVGLGIFVALIGHSFKKSIQGFHHLFEKMHIAPTLRPVIPFLISLPVGLLCGYAGGGGDALIEAVAEQQFSMKILFILLTVKILFTGISAGSGAIGGIFLPLLACGALSGVLYAHVLVSFGILEETYCIHMLLFGMAACFTAVIKAPLTACLIVFETSGSIDHLSGLIITCLVSYLTVTLIGSHAHDHTQLEQILETQEKSALHTADKAQSNSRQMYELPVQPQSAAAMKTISEVHWPDGCLIISVLRGDQELLPNGRTYLYSGDKLIILAEDSRNETVLAELTELTSGHL